VLLLLGRLVEAERVLNRTGERWPSREICALLALHQYVCSHGRRTDWLRASAGCGEPALYTMKRDC